MARIRTIKPEFFRSPDTAKVEPNARLLYVAMWCWADDFGVGETNINGLLGFAFPDEDEITAPILRRFCADLAQHYGVVFYTVAGRNYYSIPSWSKHQKIERRSDRRKHPGPDHPESAPDLRFYDCAESAPESRREIGAKSALEQGNRGTGEQGNRISLAQSADADEARDGSADQSGGFEAWWDAYGKKVGRKKAEQKYRLACRKPGVTPASLLAAAETYIASQKANGKHPEFTKDPATWLNGEHWTDEAAAETGAAKQHQPYRPQAHEIRRPPDGLSDAEMAEWHAEYVAHIRAARQQA